MKLGCSGCLGLLAWVLVGALMAGGMATVSARILALPEEQGPPPVPAEGSRAQQKLLAIARQGRRPQTVTLAETELNALLARHAVEAGRARLSRLRARLLGDDRLRLEARTPLGRALAETGLETLGDALPVSWRERPVHLEVGARLQVEANGHRELRLDVDEFRLGRQRLPASVVRLLVDPAALGLLRWRLPGHVEAVRIEPGRVVVRTGS